MLSKKKTWQTRLVVNLLCMNRDPHVEIQPRSSGVVELQELKEVWYNSLLAKKATFDEFDRVIQNLKPCIETNNCHKLRYSFTQKLRLLSVKGNNLVSPETMSLCQDTSTRNAIGAYLLCYTYTVPLRDIFLI